MAEPTKKTTRPRSRRRPTTIRRKPSNRFPDPNQQTLPIHDLPSLDQVGRSIVARFTTAGGGQIHLLRPEELRLVTGSVYDPTLDEALAIVMSSLVENGVLTGQSLNRFGHDVSHFIKATRAQGIERYGQVTVEHVADFISAPHKGRAGWVDPVASTQRHRLFTLRLFYRHGRALHLTKNDPTLDLSPPSARSSSIRPLTDEEEAMGRFAAQHTLIETRRPAAWALGQATATTAEIAAARVRDVDLANRRVWLHGNSQRRVERWGHLTDWGVEQLAARTRTLAEDVPDVDLPDWGLVYNGLQRGASGQAACSGAVHDVLAAIGLAPDQTVNPRSLPAWAGWKIYDRTGRIEDAAIAMGLRSLDTTAQHIGYEWSK
jgi:integrase